MSNQDYVANLPDALDSYEQTHDFPPEDLRLEDSYYCSFDNRYFIHCRATLPLHETDRGIGFGLWVEVDKKDFDRYLETENNDRLYSSFECVGKLANAWPGFDDTLGIKVKVKAIDTNQKVYIVDVKVDENTDPLLVKALTYKEATPEFLEGARNLINAWAHNQKLN